MERAVDFVRREFAVVQAYRDRETFQGNPVPIGRAYWAFAQVRGQHTARVVWEGQKCPSCPHGRLKYFVGPEEAEEALSCNNPACHFSLSVQAHSPEPNGEAMRRWTNVPLESSVPDYLARAERIVRARFGPSQGPNS